MDAIRAQPRLQCSTKAVRPFEYGLLMRLQLLWTGHLHAGANQYLWYRTGLAIGSQTFLVSEPERSTSSSSLTSARTQVAESGFTWNTPNYSSPSWNKLVIYELHVGTFKFDTHSTNGRGSFETVIGQLLYLQDLGVNAIQLMPSDEFHEDISWGYNPAYIFAIEASYGGPNGLGRLVDEAHGIGIAVFFDVIYNHFGPKDTDLWQFDGWEMDGAGGIYFYNDWRRKTPWGERPDYGRQEVRDYILENAVSWLEEYRCEGLRMDSTIYIRNVYGHNNDVGSDIPDGWRLMQLINSEIRKRRPWKLTIAEDLNDNPWLTQTADSGGVGFGSQWTSSFASKLRDVMRPENDFDRKMWLLRETIMQRFNDDAFHRVIYTESHDEVSEAPNKQRIPELIDPGNATSPRAQKLSTLGAAVLLTAPGIPMLFMGQEFLEWGTWCDRQQLHWSNAETFRGIRTLYRDLIRLRRNWFNNTGGLSGQNVHVHHFNENDKVIAYRWWGNGEQGDDTVIILNFANRSFENYLLGFPRQGRWHVRFNSDWKGYSPDFGGHQTSDVDATTDSVADGMHCGGSISFGKYSCVILSQDVDSPLDPGA
ncbi:hypothetical protein LTR56_027326 [Elasticomyces elasticus]|nr:hypothetical protein LTR56_027326 [Elasticomyces elasticus]KAK3616929.1 hypothetical protein LTR22_026907 [Elasticomyces elasticus]KAK4897474.1 hypothetical protein LTR49_027983 [Elasticomyces elasticus]KAK5734709.1 hypothetical protein LTS12_026645 [Elasticomyces elasticus]